MLQSIIFHVLLYVSIYISSSPLFICLVTVTAKPEEKTAKVN
jgi:hypothetical protein